MEQKKHKKRKKYRKKCPTTGRKGKHQYGVLLSRYNLAYVGKDTVNQAAKVTPPPPPTHTHTHNRRKRTGKCFTKNFMWSYRRGLSDTI